MSPTKQEFLCDDCGAEFEIKFNEEENEPTYCPFCGADLFWDEDDEEEWEDEDE